MPPELATPAQHRIVEELLAWSQPRPRVDPTLAEELRADLEAGVAAEVERIPDGEQVWISKSALDRLACDGLYLDAMESPFDWSPAVVRGKLAHRAIELDWKSDRRYGPAGLVRRAWDEMASDPGAQADFLNGLDGLVADELRHDAEQLVTEFRDTWPVLPDVAHPRLEVRTRVQLADGRVVLSGTPDLTVGGVRDDRCRMLLVDLKTGRRKPLEQRQELRFYALLLTLKYGVPPFRWAVYYVAEGAWDHEDLDPDLLRTAVRRVVDGVAQAVRLRYDRPDPSELRLVGGGYCRWCSRAATCPAAIDPAAPFDR